MKTFIYLIILGMSLMGTQVYACQIDLEDKKFAVKSIYKLSPAETIESSQLDPEDKELLYKALDTSKNAYCPFSKYHVGCSLRTVKGNIFTGCNVENDSYGLTICSERNTLTTAVAGEGSDMKLEKLAVIVIGPEGNIETLGSPCGACRQFMAQFGTQAEVIYFYKEKFYKNKVEDLLFHPFVFEK